MTYNGSYINLRSRRRKRFHSYNPTDSKAEQQSKLRESLPLLVPGLFLADPLLTVTSQVARVILFPGGAATVAVKNKNLKEILMSWTWVWGGTYF